MTDSDVPPGALSDALPGRASDEGTRRFAGRFPGRPGHFRRPDRLSLSSIGLGMRNGEVGGADDLAYRQAVMRALDCGVNVFDTALSYRMQTSERALGAALRRRIAEGQVERDEICVISKGGYVTADPSFVRSRADVRRYVYETYVDSGLIDPELVVNGNHSIEPRFLRDQIERSRRNLGLETIDVYCIQDPELHMPGKGPTEFWRELREAFAALEAAVADGAIASYGLSTWSGLLVPYTEKGHLSIAELLETALEVGGADHHLRALQLPYNLAMGEAHGLPSQFAPESEGAALLEAVLGTGTAVFAVAPLVQGRVVQQVQLPEVLMRAFPEARTNAQRALQFVRSSTGVTSAIVGMRREDHVIENLALTEQPPASPEAIASLYEDSGTPGP
jgi:aryl-alcohol dehydrogenase-like predicted oxidoreductase